MFRMKRLVFLAIGANLVCFAASQGDASSLRRIVEVGKSQNRAFTTLKAFTSRFGPRLTGSPNLAAAQDWAVQQFKAYGCQNVHKEQWGEVPVGFYRGSRQVVRMTKPWATDFQFTTPAWTPGTNGMLKVKPLLEPETAEELEKRKAEFEGAWVVMRRSAGMRGPSGQASEVENKLKDIAVAGRIYGTTDERVHTGGRFTGLEYDKLPTQVEVRVRASDYKALYAALATGRPTELELDIENHFVKGPVPQYNVIAEIPGTEKPDEVVIVCGHFDSWNGPGSVGANDNGTGSSVTLEAARILMTAGAKPKRTIRFILWSGEEQGLLGSRGYVEKHKDEMPKISAVFNDDGGTNYQGGYDCTAEMKDMLEAAIKQTQAAFPDLPMQIRVQPNMPSFGSSDHASFVQAGVPGFFTIESGKADYGFIWHTQNDRPEYSVPEYLVQSSTNAALVAFNIAAADQLLARPPKRAPAGGGGGTAVGASRIFPALSDYHDHDHSGKDHDHEDEALEYAVEAAMRWLGIRK